MRRRFWRQQCLMFSLVGFVVITFYNSSLLQIYEEDNDNREHNVKYNPPLLKKLPISCTKIIESNKEEIAKANIYMKLHQTKRMKDQEYLNITGDCVLFRESRKYNAYPVSIEEKEFPIAFSIITYKEVEQTERLLRAIYRPHNFYCIHVDKSSPAVVHEAISGIARCFENVFISSKTEDIIYNHMSRLKADLNCMSDLLNVSTRWRYMMNIPHQQFPLKTNLEMVKILKIYNGANDIEGLTTFGRMMPSRFKYSFKYVNGSWLKLGLRNNSLPYNAKMVKGSAYGIFSREFVNYVINHKEAKDVLKYMEDVKSPDEYYWATLNHNKVLHAPGRYLGDPETKPWLAVYAAWGGRDSCHGKFVRGVCIFGIEDLNELVSKKEFFANKFYTDYQYFALDCLDEYIFNRSFNSLPFETFYYKQLPFILK